jgi:hypothetical protein
MLSWQNLCEQDAAARRVEVSSLKEYNKSRIVTTWLIVCLDVTYLETCEHTYVRSLIAPTLINSTRPNKTGSIMNGKYIGDNGHVDSMNSSTTHQSLSWTTSIMKTWGRSHRSIYGALSHCQSNQWIGILTLCVPYILKYNH